MNKLLIPFLACFVLLVTGCPRGATEVPELPMYIEGLPTTRYFENLAYETSEMAPEGAIPRDPEEALAEAQRLIKERHIRVLPKAEGHEGWGKFTTTFPRKIYVATYYEDLGPKFKASTMWHELVHVRQYDRHTPKYMGMLYLTAEGRWALEVQAYRETFRAMRLFGVPEKAIQEQMVPTAEMLYEYYELGSMPRDYAITKAVEIWMTDSV